MCEPSYREQGSWSSLHDNAPPHKSKIVRDFLARKGITVLDHPPYSPDLAPADFWSFQKVKLAMKDVLIQKETILNKKSEILKTIHVLYF
jgi:transposase